MNNPYYLPNKGKHSDIPDSLVREKFEKRMRLIGYKGDWLKIGGGLYVDELMQEAWEAYYNGFRQGEDAQFEPTKDKK